MIALHTWPIAPAPKLPTIPKLAGIPNRYWDMVAGGQFPDTFWLATNEPTSDSLDGVAIHAFASEGPQLQVSDLPATCVPFSYDGQQYFCFDLSTNPASIRYIDTDVDQWLTVAPDFDTFLQQLIWRAPTLTQEAYSEQKLGHALLVARGSEIEDLLELARFNWDYRVYGQWLIWLAANRPQPIQLAVMAEFSFLHEFMPRHLILTHQQQLTEILMNSDVSEQFHFLTKKW